MNDYDVLLSFPSGRGSIPNRKFYSGYRPAFDFGTGMLHSGRILFKDKEYVEAGSEDQRAIVRFINEPSISAPLTAGTRFKLYEGRIELGEGAIQGLHKT